MDPARYTCRTCPACSSGATRRPMAARRTPLRQVQAGLRPSSAQGARPTPPEANAAAPDSSLPHGTHQVPNLALALFAQCSRALGLIRRSFVAAALVHTESSPGSAGADLIPAAHAAVLERIEARFMPFATKHNKIKDFFDSRAPPRWRLSTFPTVRRRSTPTGRYLQSPEPHCR